MNTSQVELSAVTADAAYIKVRTAGWCIWVDALIDTDALVALEAACKQVRLEQRAMADSRRHPVDE